MARTFLSSGSKFLLLEGSRHLLNSPKRSDLRDASSVVVAELRPDPLSIQEQRFEVEEEGLKELERLGLVPFSILRLVGLRETRLFLKVDRPPYRHRCLTRLPKLELHSTS